MAHDTRLNDRNDKTLVYTEGERVCVKKDREKNGGLLEDDTCQQIWTCGPTPRCRKTREHSGSSPRSAKSDSSSSPIGKTIAAMSAESAPPAQPLSAKIGLSSTVDDVVSMSANQPNSSCVRSDSLLRSANVGSWSWCSCCWASGASVLLEPGLFVTAAAAAELELLLWWWLWWLREAGQGWLCSEE